MEKTSKNEPVIVPRVGRTPGTVTLVQWYKSPGQRIRRGEPLLQLGTDKVIVDVESTTAGFLGSVTAAPGEVVTPGEQIAVISPTPAPDLPAGAVWPPPPKRPVS